jgi:sugar O-acyltransferase (sialic acid O-acetyltransferase NeuD family)
MKKIIIIGGKGTAVVIAEQIIDARERFGAEIIFMGYAFDDESMGGEINGYPILCKTTEVKDKYEHMDDVYFIYSLYRSDLIKERVELRNSYGIPDNKFINFIHPTAYVARSARMGYGNVILANVVINPNVELGNYNTFNSAALIGHDTEIGNNNFFAGHSCIGSNICIKNCVFVGLNASVRNFVILNDYSLVGMSSNVVKNIEEGKTVIGNPARIIN